MKTLYVLILKVSGKLLVYTSGTVKKLWKKVKEFDKKFYSYAKTLAIIAEHQRLSYGSADVDGRTVGVNIFISKRI